MNRMLWCVAVTLVFSQGTLFATDYLIHVKTFGYQDANSDKGRPSRVLLNSCEIVARPNILFHGRTTIGPNRLSL